MSAWPVFLLALACRPVDPPDDADPPGDTEDSEPVDSEPVDDSDPPPDTGSHPPLPHTDETDAPHTDDTDPVDTGLIPPAYPPVVLVPDVPRVAVRAGTFTMGTPGTLLRWLPDSQPPHQVTITRDFELGVRPVTQGEFEAWMGTNPSGFTGCTDCPVERVTWHAAAAFANALSDAAALERCFTCTGSLHDDSLACEPVRADITACAGFRLPTEAEWEFAARERGRHADMLPAGGSVPVMDELTSCDADVLLDDGTWLSEQAWTCVDSAETTHPVGAKRANALGLQELSGSVWEWTHDWWGDYPADPQVDPVGPSSGPEHVVRGGSWFHPAVNTDVCGRFYHVTAAPSSHQGMRIARTLELP